MRSNLVALAVVGTILAGSGCALIDRWSGITETRRIQAIGIPASGEILEIWDTGMTLNDNPVIGLRVIVSPQDGDPYEAIIAKSVVSRVHLPQFQPGSIVPLMCDPAAPQRVALDMYEY